MTDFSDHPESVAERRAAIARDCKLWTPRDALISVLRDIDSGAIDPDTLVVAYRTRQADGSSSHGYALAGDPDVIIATLTQALHSAISS